ncbi:MAG: DUF484 family protein [Gammaproteobacteria bacterium]
MSTLEQPKNDVSDIDEGLITAYLQSNPEFFERHPSVLAKLRLPHSTGGPAVSLVERQVAVLRQKNMQLESQLRELLEVARGNDQLAERIHRLALLLMQSEDPAEVVGALEEQLRISFKADRAVLVLFHQVEALHDSRFLRMIDRDDESLSPFKTFLESGNTRCGRVRDAQHRFLFGEGDVEIGSVALLPLGKGGASGFLAVGNRDAEYFHPGKSIDFLAKLGELVSCALSR